MTPDLAGETTRATALEAFAASLPQSGRAANEDAFLLRPGPSGLVALADGAGAAEQAARRALRQFERSVAAAGPGDLASFPVWCGWLRQFDAALLGGAQSTFVAAALHGERLVGAAVGDSRALLWTREGELRLLAESAGKARLGSGRIEPGPIHVPFGRGDLLLLLSDGAWTPRPLARLRATVARHALGRLAELPEAVLREASRAGRADDMTVVVARRR